jgi:hypothetical protein
MLTTNCKRHLNWASLLQCRNCILKLLPVDRALGVVLLRLVLVTETIWMFETGILRWVRC